MFKIRTSGYYKTLILHPPLHCFPILLKNQNVLKIDNIYYTSFELKTYQNLKINAQHLIMSVK